MLKFRIEHHEEVTSTNTLALERAEHGEPEGLVIVADYQTLGRGKPGRAWESPKGKDLLFSILLRPPMKPAEAPGLTQVACRVVAKVLKEKYDIASVFKRPNDIMAGSKKICGTLVEAVTKGNRLEAVVIGIGLNVNSEAPELSSEGVSMKQIKGIMYSGDEILNLILEELRKSLPHG